MDEILEEGLLIFDSTVTHYYSKEEEERKQMEEEKEEKLQYLIVANPTEDHITEFLKLPRATTQPRAIHRIEPLVDYSQSQ